MEQRWNPVVVLFTVVLGLTVLTFLMQGNSMLVGRVIDSSLSSITVTSAAGSGDIITLYTPPEGYLMFKPSPLVFSGVIGDPYVRSLTITYVNKGVSTSQYITILMTPGSFYPSGDLAVFDAAAANLDEGTYTFTLTADTTLGIVQKNVSILLSKAPIRQGWPQATQYYVESSPTVADLNQDGKPEILIGSMDKLVYAFNADGSLFPGWPQSTTDWPFSSPAVGDVDGDGYPEVVVGDENGYVFVWNRFGLLMPGWPQRIGMVVEGSAVLADLDKDGKLDIILGAFSYLTDTHLFAFHGDGTPLAGWPVATGSIDSTPAVADLDGDGSLEVVVAALHTFPGYGLYGSRLYAIHANGSIQKGFPVDINKSVGFPLTYVQSSPAIGDITGDGKPEIVLGVGDSQWLTGGVYAWHTNGSLVKGWPFVSSSPLVNWWGSTALSDFNDDGVLEVVVGSNQGVWAFKGNASVLPGWPVLSEQGTSDVSVADVNNDGKLEILYGHPSETQAAFEIRSTNGSSLQGWPKMFPAGISVMNAPTVADLDGNNSVSIIFGTLNFNVYALDLGAHLNPVLMHWPKSFHDERNTGTYTNNFLCGDISNDYKLTLVDLSTITAVLFRDAPLPATWKYADMDANGVLNIADLLRLMDVLYNNGNASCEPVPPSSYKAGVQMSVGAETMVNSTLVIPFTIDLANSGYAAAAEFEFAYDAAKTELFSYEIIGQPTMQIAVTPKNVSGSKSYVVSIVNYTSPSKHERIRPGKGPLVKITMKIISKPYIQPQLLNSYVYDDALHPMALDAYSLFCSGGIPTGACGNYKYCNAGTLIENCAVCGCPPGMSCEKVGLSFQCTGGAITVVKDDPLVQ